MGGAEAMVANLTLGLAADGFEARAVSFFDPRGTRFERELADGGVHVSYLGKRLGFDARLFPGVANEIARFRPHVLHSHLAVLPYALPAYLANPRVPAFHTVHNVVEQEADTAGRLAGKALFRWRVRPVAVAEAVAVGVRKMYGAVAPVIMNGIDLRPLHAAGERRSSSRARYRLSEGKFAIVCVARLMPQKNHAGLIRAFGLLAQRLPQLTLLLVGDGPLRPALEEQVRQAGLHGRVRFLGASDDVPSLLAAADAFVLSSHFEGNPLSVMEALAAGLPVVASAVGGVPELITDGENGLLAAPGDDAGLAWAVERLVSEKGLAQRLGRAASARSERYGLEAMVRAYEGLYEAALTRRLAPGS